jgi:hypothetical protein
MIALPNKQNVDEPIDDAQDNLAGGEISRVSVITNSMINLQGYAEALE